MILHIIAKCILRLFSIFPINNHRILFYSYRGASYSCNPKYIAEKLVEHGNNLDLVWILNEGITIPSGMRQVRNKSFRMLYAFATAKIWISNTRMPPWIVKRKNQYYIQTWHAGISNKPGEGFTIEKLPKLYVNSAIRDSKMADLFLSDSKWLTDSYRKGFWYDGEILEVGLPREDVLLNDVNEYHNKVCSYYSVPYDTHFVLYAPTFRSNGDLKCYNIDYHRMIQTLKRKYGGEWKALIRLHPNIRDENISMIYDSICINASLYDEINELILASDYLISDYSSCLFDGMLAKRRVIIYASDIDEYERDRGFFFKWDDLPFLLATNNDDLEEIIKTFRDDIYREKVDQFKSRCGYVLNGDASKKVADYIINYLRSNT